MQRTGSTLPVVAPASGSGSGSGSGTGTGTGSDESDALMHRPSVSVVEHDGVGADDDTKATAGLQSDEEDDEDARGRRETDETNLAYMWSLLLATLAESLNACFVPNWYILDFNINAAATMINFVGPFMDGMAFGYEEIHKSRADATLTPCLQYRAAFLGVFTSYSYMVDHAGDLSEDYFLIGPLYIIASLAIACASFHLGKLFILIPAIKRLLQLLVSSTIVTKLPSFQLASILFIIVTAARAVFGDPGFVQDPKEPRFISSIRVADGEELILGIFMSCSGILISDYLADRFEPQPDANGHVSFLDWGNIICNFVSCWLTCLAYEASKFSPNHVRNNLLVMKFVSSFCGSISNFSAGISHIMLLWQGGNRYGAMWNLALHLVTGLVFLPYLRKIICKANIPRISHILFEDKRQPGDSPTTMTSGMPDALVQRLREKQQDHVLKFYEAGALDADQTAALTQQLEALDLDLLESIFQASTTGHPATANTTATVEPLDEVDLLANCSDADRQRWQDRGLEAIASGHVCALVMSGGQGTRLGFAGPKGLYDIGLPSEKSLFQLFAERVLKVQTLAAAAFPSASGDTTTTPLPLFVMTSLMNHDETVAYFRTHAFFGLEESQVFFFSQGTLPCFTMDGKLMLENAATLATASDGNGGIYKALAQSGGLDRLTERGVQYLHVFSVDNALCKVADPVFIGYCIDKRADCGNKVVWKSRADESVGVVAKKDGQYCVVEYSEMDAEACARTDPVTGKLVFGAANICNHFFTTEFLKTVVLPQLSLAYHVAQKKIPIADENGETYTPTVTSGVKLEAFIFDTFPLSSRMAVLAVPRETEFAPVKNAPGSAVDSPDTARQMIVDEATAWLMASAEATLSKEETEQFRTQKLEAASMIEISPLVSFNGEGLESYVTALRDAPSQTVLRLESVDIPASRSSIPPSIRERFENADQHHIFQFADQGVISAHEACALVEDIRALDPAVLNDLFQRSTTTADADAHSQPVEIEPLGDDVVDLLASTPEEVRAEWMKRGLDAVAKGTVAALVLAGGQGTRLGFAGPKGMFDIGLPSHKSLFEIFALRVRKVQRLAQAAYHLAETPRLPFLVMTSEMNHDTTVEFFKTHDYFGLDADQVRFFRQGTLPSFTLNGKLMLETKSSVSRASDGNGGVYPALKRSRVLDYLENTCVQYLHVFSVDNILCKVADPVFIGYCVAHDADCANKVVWKDRPDESVGVFATKNGTFCVVEYSELDTASSERINPTTAKLAFGAANICNHFYRLDFLKKCCGLDASAAYHVAKKKIPYVDAAGTTIVPTTVSGIKLETFIFDVFQHATNMKVLGVERNDEFAPVKNASGASSDSPDTARHLVSQQCMRWLLQAGATFDERSNGLCEILPTVSYNGEGLEAIAKALSPIHLPVLIDEETESA